MNLGTRIGPLESAAGSNPPVVHLQANDEADLREKFENLLLTSKPGPLVIDIDLAGVRSRQYIPFRTHEERLELLAQEAGTDG